MRIAMMILLRKWIIWVGALPFSDHWNSTYYMIHNWVNECAHLSFFSQFFLAQIFIEPLIILLVFFFFFFFFFRAAPMGYGNSPARDQIGTAVVSHSHSHSNLGPKLCLQPYTTAHGNTRSLTHWARPEIEPSSSWILVRFVTTEPWQELSWASFFIVDIST